jgi:hypothetical protein
MNGSSPARAAWAKVSGPQGEHEMLRVKIGAAMW